MVIPNDLWAKALHESTACLRVQRQNRRSDESSLSQLMPLLDMAMEYLSILENQLVALNNSQSEENAEAWSHPPARPPPTWVQFSELYTHDKDRAIQEAYATSGAPPHYEDDDAGDVPNPYGMNGDMDCRRLHIRILTSQSEIFASKASLFAARDCKHFKEGANQLQMGLDKIHQALQVADSQISKWWADMERTQLKNAAFRTREKDALVEDANIVEVAIQNMTQRREKLLSLCQQEQNWLLRQLEPQWESRDEVKQRLGEERWTNNPRPKRDYAEMRRDLEIRLRAVRQAMEALQAMDPTMALQRANTMQYQLQHGVRPENGNVVTNGESRDESKQDDEMMRERRYNGIRPTTEWMSRRVDIQQYPDPTSFGWKFTGSWQAVEFFERMVVLDEKEYSVKLDWYFTTATIKTSLDHPTQGKTQLFGKQVSPDEYKKILENPRVHTGMR
ncbi:hypothetical protein IV203_015478 [Nitzschia inconspicua]|uniref:Uncharacterized protein n=1 Tax=Nitzschia inconspicua TaxID=303405 RepID=A0A9K3PVP4_9STRA|nr:hypothetical protein IV203_015478 [Nitzschia inconspicua]